MRSPGNTSVKVELESSDFYLSVWTHCSPGFACVWIPSHCTLSYTVDLLFKVGLKGLKRRGSRVHLAIFPLILFPCRLRLLPDTRSLWVGRRCLFSTFAGTATYPHHLQLKTTSRTKWMKQRSGFQGKWRKQKSESQRKWKRLRTSSLTNCRKPKTESLKEKPFSERKVIKGSWLWCCLLINDSWRSQWVISEFGVNSIYEWGCDIFVYKFHPPHVYHICQVHPS